MLDIVVPAGDDRDMTLRPFHRYTDHIGAAARTDLRHGTGEPRLGYVTAAVRGTASFLGLVRLPERTGS